MSELMNVSSGPHVRAKYTTGIIMFIVVMALMPATAYGIYHFGINAAILVVTCVGTSVLTELLYELIFKMPITVMDLSAVVTGLLLALNLPQGVPWWIAVLGSVFAILVVKMCFGGIGQNFMNPALAARCFLMICFASRMTNFEYDGFSGATPLSALKNGESVDLKAMVFGNIPGTIGETSVIAILIGACIMVAFGIIDLKIPLSYIVTFVIFMGFFAGQGFDINYIVAQLAGGGLMLGAFFMATDYTTSPMTGSGKIIYGICLGILTGVFRIFSSSAEGVSFAIILGNLLVPLIEMATIPKCFGKGGEV